MDVRKSGCHRHCTFEEPDRSMLGGEVPQVVRGYLIGGGSVSGKVAGLSPRVMRSRGGAGVRHTTRRGPLTGPATLSWRLPCRPREYSPRQPASSVEEIGRIQASPCGPTIFIRFDGPPPSGLASS